MIDQFHEFGEFGEFGEFARLHVRGAGFVMPNAWDAGSAVVLAEAGFPAIATTSAGIAFSLGRADHSVPAGSPRVSHEEMFQRIRQITAAVDVPVNGDLEDGYGARPEAVAETIRLAIEAGLAGGNIEDHAGGRLYDEALAVERIIAAREVSPGFVLTARTDGRLLPSPAPLADSIRRANLYREAGADCLYVPGVNDLDTVATLVKEIDGPINVVMGLGATTLTVAALREAGVARISLGGSIARAALGLVRDAARELQEHGTLGFAARQIPQAELNALFSK
ncbi:2-methylisocitrate lyase-like PEP mutase family enzyme [Thermocatellispora tengchongensis]|uniref:2-methylisocitrate lyase-like PEP mutase family enzyme n=1 Tax=Thermocatellispora tengchongensis TaxID=1073253 RepID=A0A840NZ92_9ACTN|nr:isocitrate lyase/phosphoenolpyruvate mutase family protein [Thermocatellispora tengchongensis]MBB5130327.1 2-methylisocitrate lyase-like PEP mutase family enzyme [Thermocatellispora tengchongensis]